MRIEKNIIEKVANGETFMTGEPVENAKTILKPEVWSSFKRYAFFYEGDDNNLNDIQDCILDFPIHAAEITIMEIPKEVHPGEKRLMRRKTIQDKRCKRKVQSSVHCTSILLWR